MLVIALTGGIGSGKSTVAKLFAERGVTIIDTDQLARDVTQAKQPAFDKIVKKFGADIVSPDGGLDRAKLRTLVFADADKRLWLEKLLHPLIRIEMEKQVVSAKPPYCIVIIPLLFETKPNPLINRILVVDTNEKQQIQRTHTRDNISEKDILAILETQVNRHVRLSGAHDVICNDGKLEDLNQQVERLHKLYLSMSN